MDGSQEGPVFDLSRKRTTVNVLGWLGIGVWASLGEKALRNWKVATGYYAAGLIGAFGLGRWLSKLDKEIESSRQHHNSSGQSR